MPPRLKHKLPHYIPMIIADLIISTNKHWTSVYFGFGDKFLLYKRLLDLGHR